MKKEDSPLKKAVNAVKQHTAHDDATSSADSQNTQADEGKASHDDVANLLAKISDLTEALQRERADAANVRRRADEERLKMAGFYKSLVVRELLPFIDNLDRALKHLPEAPTADQSAAKLYDWAKGVVGIKKQFDEALQRLGVERIATVGEAFNPQLHEAITMEEGEGTTEVVTEELQAGYRVGDEVIRHAMVKVTMQ